MRGDPARWAALGQPPCRGLPDTLARMPATAQDRLAARLFLVMPLAVGALALFWGLSGVVALARREAAEAVLLSRGAPPALAAATVVGGAILDLALALAVLWRPWARAACLGMALVALGYLAGATLLAPGLWADPLGPLLKVIPGVVLALAAAAMLEER